VSSHVCPSCSSLEVDSHPCTLSAITGRWACDPTRPAAAIEDVVARVDHGALPLEQAAGRIVGHCRDADPDATRAGADAVDAAAALICSPRVPRRVPLLEGGAR
jgi:hypothetical protein